MVQPPTNTATVSSSDRSASSSCPTLHSTVARRVRWRSGRSTAPVPSASSEAASRSSSAAGSSSRVRAAASSIASGSPSSRRYISATAAAFPSVSAKPGRTARARSTNSATAGEAATSATGTLTGPPGTLTGSSGTLAVPPGTLAGGGSGGTGYSLGRQPQRRPAGRQHHHAWAAGQQLAQVTGHSNDLLQVVQ